MTIHEAIDQLESLLGHCKTMRESGEIWARDCEALRIAIATLRGPTREQDLWHDAKTDPPETPGLYYGKKDDTNSMYACRYRDGVWVLDAYPQSEMDIVQWADYSAFAREDVEHSLRGPTRERVEKVWRGEWIGSADGYADGELVYDIWECSECGYVIDEEDDPDMLPQFCPKCYAPMTDEAVDIVMERLEALKDGTTD